MGENYEWRYPGFRRCRVCGKVQEFKSWGNDEYWDTLTSEQTEIYNRIRVPLLEHQHTVQGWWH